MSVALARALFPAIVAVALTGAAAQEPPRGASQVADPAAAAKPGVEHAKLAALVGEYLTQSKVFMEPGAPPRVSEGSASISSVLGGRFIIEENRGALFGQTTEGVRIYGFNKSRGQYETTWTYTNSTAILKMTGAVSPGNTIDFRGTFDDAGGRQSPVHARLKLLSDGDIFVVELMAATPDGGSRTLVETTYQRQSTTSHRKTLQETFSQEAPGPAHDALKILAGEWKVDVEFKIGPGPMCKGKARLMSQWVLSGRHLKQQYESVLMGKPFQVLQYVGYDNLARRSFEVHLNNARTGVLYADGSLTKDGKTLIHQGELVDVVSREKSKIRTVLTVLDADHYTLQWFQEGKDGIEQLVVRMSHTRVR